MPTPRIAIGVLCVSTLLAACQAGSSTPVASADWWKGEVCYEVFVRSFYDSDGDGVGDLRGLIQRLDYINDGDPRSRTDLGAGCIWLMPVSQSPSYHGYDVTNYYAIERDYGTEDDFRELVTEAHRRGIRIIYDLVLNHTSSEHPFFRDAAMDPQSPYRDWFIWRSEPRPMPGWQAPTWHANPFDDQYYFGLFWAGMPDLNLANPEVQAETRRIARFWIEEMDVDGLRLDAVAHFFEQGGQWRHAPANHPWLRGYGAFIREMDPAVFTVGEVYDERLDSILPYYPDQLDSYFMFEAANAMITAARTGSKGQLVGAVERLQTEIPDQRYSTLLRNHDQTRTMTELDGDYGRAGVAATLLLTLPGNPFVYYGEELGMTGAKSRGDPRLRTPMHWARQPAAGFTPGVPWEPLRPDSFSANVETLEPDSMSLLNLYRHLIPLRTSTPALARGDFLDLDTGNDQVLAFLRRGPEQTAVILVNLGDTAVTDITVSAPAGALEPGSYQPAVRWGEPLADLSVADDGGFGSWVAANALGPFEARIAILEGG
jgi:alpha-amylase